MHVANQLIPLLFRRTVHVLQKNNFKLQFVRSQDSFSCFLAPLKWALTERRWWHSSILFMASSSSSIELKLGFVEGTASCVHRQLCALISMTESRLRAQRPWTCDIDFQPHPFWTDISQSFTDVKLCRETFKSYIERLSSSSQFHVEEHCEVSFIFCTLPL